MKTWQLIAAILVAVLLVGAVVFLLVRSAQKEPEPTPPTQPLSSITMREVVRFTVRGANGSETRLERDAINDWYIVKPIAAKADQNLVTWLLADLLSTESSNAAPASNIDLSYAGLLTPTGSIVLGLSTGVEQVLQVGLPEPNYMAYFVRIDDSVYLFPWDVVDRAMLWLDVMPIPPATAPAGDGQ
jgi:Domain of unknown function (DUF4340)